MSKVTLQPVEQRIPNSLGIYSPSELRPKRIISKEKFLKWYAQYPIRMRICFDKTPSLDTMLQRSEEILAYSFGLDCWYVVA